MRKYVVIIDDSELNREILSDILEEDFTILEAENGQEGIELIEKQQDDIAVVLLDLCMPVYDGYEVLKILHKKKLVNQIPILIITGDHSPESERRCFELGASDFIHRPFDRRLVIKRVQNMVDLYACKNDLEEKVRIQTRKLERQAQKLLKTNKEIISIMGNVVESRNLESGAHISRVKGYTRILANNLMKLCPQYGLNSQKIDVIAEASALHDLGKIAISDTILLKPGRLTPEEFEIMKTHTTEGCALLERMGSVWDKKYRKTSYEICRYHHERFDGRGYPDHLEGNNIPLSAQIVSIADVYDALVNERCYKDAFAPEKAYNMIVNGECGTFNPDILKSFEKSRNEFEVFTKKSKR